MKQLWTVLILACLAAPVYAIQRYTIRGTLTGTRSGQAILKQADRADTFRIVNGRFEGKGIIEKPVAALLEIQPSSDVPVQLVLEAGVLLVTEKKGSYRISGSANNDQLQAIRDALQPYASQVKILRGQSYQERGLAQKALLKQIDSVIKERTYKADELVKANANLAGFIIMLTCYRKETPGNVSRYLTQFKAFADDPGYGQVMEFYKEMSKAEAGYPAPLFTLPDTQGNMVSLNSFKGKYVLVDFWYHNCGFCRKMIPGLKNIYRDLKDKAFEIVSISVDTKSFEKEWREAIREDGPDWIELWDNETTMPGQYGVEGYPNMFLLDKEGKLLRQIVGFTSEEAMRKILNEYGL